MVYLEFGDGKLLVDPTVCAVPILQISRLDENQEVGSKVEEGTASEGAVKMIFKNKEGLEVLLNAILRCMTGFETKIPDELRLGA